MIDGQVAGQVLEAVMLICFGLSWPLNAYKNFKARTAAGTSWQFIALITLGYVAGIAAKFFANAINWVLIVYFINIVCIGVNWAVYFRNVKLDRARIEGASIKGANPDSLDNVIIACDGSRSAINAVHFAAENLELANASLIEILAVSPNKNAKTVAMAQKALDDGQKALKEYGIESKGVIRYGEPAAEIVSLAEGNNHNLIVMGSRGLSGLREMMLGSVSKAVANKAGCPVVIVK